MTFKEYSATLGKKYKKIIIFNAIIVALVYAYFLFLAPSINIQGTKSDFNNIKTIKLASPNKEYALPVSIDRNGFAQAKTHMQQIKGEPLNKYQLIIVRKNNKKLVQSLPYNTNANERVLGLHAPTFIHLMQNQSGNVITVITKNFSFQSIVVYTLVMCLLANMIVYLGSFLQYKHLLKKNKHLTIGMYLTTIKDIRSISINDTYLGVTHNLDSRFLHMLAQKHNMSYVEIPSVIAPKVHKLKIKVLDTDNVLTTYRLELAGGVRKVEFSLNNDAGSIRNNLQHNSVIKIVHASGERDLRFPRLASLLH